MKRECTGAILVRSAVLSASSSLAFRPRATQYRSVRSGFMKSNRTASGSSVAEMAIPSACSAGAGTIGQISRIVDALLALSVESIVIDGEGVVCGCRLRCTTCRSWSQGLTASVSVPLWDARRDTLTTLLREAGDGIMLSEHTDGAKVFQHACRMGLEGIIAKRRDRPCRSGRSLDWIKVKNPSAPAVRRLLEE
jgi:hypothetical protein